MIGGHYLKGWSRTQNHVTLSSAEAELIALVKCSAELLGMSVAGASKLLARGVDCGLLVEITQRRTWRVFLSTDLAVEFGFAAPKRGRPRKEVPPPPATRALVDVFEAFDREMANIDELLRRSAGAV